MENFTVELLMESLFVKLDQVMEIMKNNKDELFAKQVIEDTELDSEIPIEEKLQNSNNIVKEKVKTMYENSKINPIQQNIYKLQLVSWHCELDDYLEK